MSLPRRANGIRDLAAQMASKKLAGVNARQAVSDRIGYAVATVIGGLVTTFAGWWGLVAVVTLYAFSASRAYRRYRTLQA